MAKPSDAAIRELAHQILARPEYANATSNKYVAELLRRILGWINNLGALQFKDPFLYWIVIVALVVVLVALVTHLVWTLRAALRAPEPSGRPVIGGRTMPDLAGEADALAADGRYLEAAHRLMLASFRALAETSVIELSPERSNRWIRAALRESSLAQPLAVELDALVERTERKWFGERANDARIYAEWRSAFERLTSAAM